MTDSLPAPPVPDDLDLRDCQWMPLDVVRLRDSDLAMVPDAEVFRVSVLSWCVSWHQTPAASLPDDDAALARLHGFGRDLKGWRKVRAAGGLRGWIKHSDGRLYHPVVAAKALEAQEQKCRSERKRDKDAERLRKWREQRDGNDPGNGDDTHGETRFVAERPNQTLPNLTVPNHTPSPPSPESPGQPAPAAASAGLRKIIRGYDPKRLLVAIEAGDLLAVVATFGGNLERGDEWARDSAGQRIGVIALIFDWRMDAGTPIREPSGLRKAIEEWTSKPKDWRKRYLKDFAADIGLPVLIPGEQAQDGGQA